MVKASECPAGTDLTLVRDPDEDGVCVGGKFWPYERIYVRPDDTAFKVFPETRHDKPPPIPAHKCTADDPCCPDRLLCCETEGSCDPVKCPVDCVCHA